MQLYPSPRLAEFVSHYLIIKQAEGLSAVHRFFPDGHPGIVFQFGDVVTPINQDATIAFNPSRSLIYGQIDQYFNLGLGRRVDLLIVVLKPFGLSHISSVPTHELTNQPLPLEAVLGNAGHQLTEQVLSAVDSGTRIALIENFLQKITLQTPRSFDLVKASLHKIDQARGQLPIQQISQDLGITERALERIFQQQVGITPKQYSRVMRLQHYFKLRQQHPDFPLTALGYEAGFYDQAHFIREFKGLVGLTPSQYDKGKHRLAVNLMPV